MNIVTFAVLPETEKPMPVGCVDCPELVIQNLNFLSRFKSFWNAKYKFSIKGEEETLKLRDLLLKLRYVEVPNDENGMSFKSETGDKLLIISEGILENVI